MHPALISRLRAKRAFTSCGGFEGWPSCHPQGPVWHGPGESFEGGFGGGGGHFGVRRPLRFLAHKLDLDEKQIATLARILDELKTERAQGEVDRRRTVAAFADALSGETFDTAKAGEGGELRVQSEVRLRDAVLKALNQIHAILNPDQRTRLAYLIRTGAILI
jgi:Spy/CpxP family protein refolding chaperone